MGSGCESGDHPRPVKNFGLDAGLFVALFKPPTDPDPTDPDAVPVGGFDYGSLDVALTAAVESDQRFEEANALFGGHLLYVVSRQDFPWPLVPAVRLTAALVTPVTTELDEGVDVHGRLDVRAAWHVPLLTMPLTVHADVQYWNAFGLPDEAESVRDRTGVFAGFALGYDVSTMIGKTPLHEVFVRWSGGDSPLRASDERAWVAGVVLGSRSSR